MSVSETPKKRATIFKDMFRQKNSCPFSSIFIYITSITTLHQKKVQRVSEALSLQDLKTYMYGDRDPEKRNCTCTCRSLPAQQCISLGY